MKNLFKTAMKKVKDVVGGSSSRCSDHSDGDSQGRRREGSARFSWATKDIPSDEQGQEE